MSATATSFLAEWRRLPQQTNFLAEWPGRAQTDWAQGLPCEMAILTLDMKLTRNWLWRMRLRMSTRAHAINSLQGINANNLSPTSNMPAISLGDREALEEMHHHMDRSAQRMTELNIADLSKAFRRPLHAATEQKAWAMAGTKDQAQDKFCTFTCFGKLPTEIRLKIWRLLVPIPRVIRLECNDNRQLRNTIPHPVLLRICHETRAEYSKAYEFIRLDNSATGFYINVDIDTLLFSVPLNKPNMQATIRIAQYALLSKVKHVALDGAFCGRVRGDTAEGDPLKLHRFLSQLTSVETSTVVTTCVKECCGAILLRIPQTLNELELWQPDEPMLGVLDLSATIHAGVHTMINTAWHNYQNYAQPFSGSIVHLKEPNFYVKSLRAVGQTELSCAWDQDTWDHNNLEEYVIDLFLEELSI